MAEGAAATGDQRYAAFISYSHKDAPHARWLHRKLETYCIPRRLVGCEGEYGPIAARLTPVFRDRDELPAAGDLTGKVRSALGASEALIVICSPNAAASPWVAREIEVFRQLHPGRAVLAAIVAGDPASCFPKGLAGAAVEPLAADLRPEGDGRRLGILKLVAGLAGVGLDALVQRDAARRVRRVTAITLAALIAMLAMGVLTILALNARAEAERQRAEAEGLVEFMLTDLRDRLEGVGRLDVLTAVNRRALAHYKGQELEDLTAASLERRARILHAMGEDDQRRGDLGIALAQFKEAARTTAALLADQPDDPRRIFAHAQSEFWIGSVDYERGDLPRSKSAFERYRRLSERLVAIDPKNPEWLKEAGYAEGNLCSIALNEPIDAREALRACMAALAHMETAAQRSVDPSSLQADLANRHGWLADAYFRSGRADRALAQRKQQELLLAELIARDPKNMDYRDLLVTNQMSLAGLEAWSGSVTAARQRLNEALSLVDTLVQMDPANQQWARRRDDVQQKISNLPPLRQSRRPS